MRSARLRLLAATALTASACATAPPPTPEEAALIEEMSNRSIAPATAEARAAIGEADLLSQVTFWGEQYDNNPADRDAALHFARTSRAVGQPARAVAVANNALALRPNDPGLLSELGAALIMDGRAPAAGAPLARAVDIDPMDARARGLYGAALDHAGEHDAARDQYEAALAIQGDNPAVLSNYAMSFTLSGDPGSAEQLLRRALVLPGADGRVRQNLALTLALQGKFDEAEQLAQQDLARDVAEANIAYVRSLIERPRQWDGLRGTLE